MKRKLVIFTTALIVSLAGGWVIFLGAISHRPGEPMSVRSQRNISSDVPPVPPSSPYPRLISRIGALTTPNMEITVLVLNTRRAGGF